MSQRAEPLGVMSHNTPPVTLLTNFRLVPGHTVTPIAFRDSQNLCFMPELGCTPSDAVHLQVTPLPDLPDHRGSLPPTLSPVYSISLTSCFCPTLLSCVSHSCNIAYLCSLSHFRYPRSNALLPILVYKTPAYVCIRHV